METHKPKNELDKLLDEALMATFPCSDPFNFQTTEGEPSPAPDEKDKAAAEEHRKKTAE